MFMVCSNPKGRAREPGVEIGMSIKSSPPAEKRLGFLQAASSMLGVGILEKAELRRTESQERKIFGGLPAPKVLINLESAPEMEGNGNVWKGVSGLRCAQSDLDCA
jgi:hypothetical protein